MAWELALVTVCVLFTLPPANDDDDDDDDDMTWRLCHQSQYQDTGRVATLSLPKVLFLCELLNGTELMNLFQSALADDF